MDQQNLPATTGVITKLHWCLMLTVLFFYFSLASCKKETETFEADVAVDYYPLQVGKYITYQLDSTLFTNFGQTETQISYEAKDVVDAEITDNQGQASYRIIRYLRRSAGDDWEPNNTFLVTKTPSSIEFVENNLRYIKLTSPVRSSNSWKGNSYIDTYTDDNDIRYMNDWNYTYDSVGLPLTINGHTFPNTLKVAQRDEFLGQDPSVSGTQYAEKNFSEEKYAKGIGLISRDFIHWEYQGAQPGRPAYYEGFGISMKIIDFN